LEQLAGMHEIELWVELEQLSGHLISLELHLLALSLLFELLALLLPELCCELLVTLLA